MKRILVWKKGRFIFKENICGVYRFRCLADGGAYVGGSNHILDRVQHHINRLRIKRHKCDKLQNSWWLNGEDLFVVELLERCKNENLKRCEDDWARRELNWLGTRTNFGFKHTKLTKKKIGINTERSWKDGKIVPYQRTRLSRKKLSISLKSFYETHPDELVRRSRTAKKNWKSGAFRSRKHSTKTKIKMKNSWTKERRKAQAARITKLNKTRHI